jgi:hypothetical protein
MMEFAYYKLILEEITQQKPSLLCDKTKYLL